MYETLRIVEKLKPNYVIWENVKNLLSKKHKHNFDNYIEEMEKLGYASYYKVLNSKNYGIPQSRERVFTISIKKDLNQTFQFPKEFPLKIKLKDILEDKVDEKYYLTNRAIEGAKNTHFNQNKIEKRILNDKEVHPTICARFTGAPTLIQEEHQLSGSYGRNFGSKGKLQNKEDVCDTLQAAMGTGGGNIPIILDDNETKINVIGNYSPSGHEASRIIDPNGIAPTFKDNHGTVTAIIENNEQIGLYDNTSSENFAKGKRDYGYREEYGTVKCQPKYAIYKSSDLRIRKLTPREVWRLMGFTDEEFEKAEKVNSGTQLYKQAGNSIVVNVLVEIFKKLFKE